MFDSMFYLKCSHRYTVTGADLGILRGGGGSGPEFSGGGGGGLGCPGPRDFHILTSKKTPKTSGGGG